jgi:hypothetical protein
MVDVNLDNLSTRVGEIDNSCRENDKELEGVRTAFKELSSAIVMHEMAIRKLYIGYTSQSILADALVRYMAGYEEGDYLNEVQKVKDSGRGPELQDLLAKNPQFDGARLAAIAKEIASVQAEEHAKAKAEADEAQTSKILAPNGKPVLKLVK